MLSNLVDIPNIYKIFELQVQCCFKSFADILWAEF